MIECVRRTARNVKRWQYDERNILQRGPTLVGLGLAGLLITVPRGGPLWVFARGYSAFLATYRGYVPPANAEVAARSRPEDRRAALLAFDAAMWTGAAVAPSVAVGPDVVERLGVGRNRRLAGGRGHHPRRRSRRSAPPGRSPRRWRTLRLGDRAQLCDPHST